MEFPSGQGYVQLEWNHMRREWEGDIHWNSAPRSERPPLEMECRGWWKSVDFVWSS
jgi:hypothetical protein